MDRDGWLLYGAYGYTGALIAGKAREQGAEPILAGRDPERTAELADDLGLPYRIFGLGDPGEVRRGLEGVSLVLNAAGPYSRTFRPMVDACLDLGCHYLDVTGEYDVLEEARSLGDRAEMAEVVLLPAVGFDVVPSDCAAAQAVGTVSDATHLDIAFFASGGPSRGTARTVVEGGAKGGRVRREGRIVEVRAGSVTRPVPFSDGTRDCVAIPWGDLSTAHHSTGVPNIRVFTPAPGWARLGLRVVRALLAVPLFRRVVRAAVDRVVDGPDRTELARGRGRVWAEARNAEGRTARVEFSTPNGYALTAATAVEAVERVLAGRVAGPGFRSPSDAFGSDFLEAFPGVERLRDLP